MNDPLDENGNATPLTINFVKSSMTRATQTANIILKHFPEVTEHQTCDLIREGAPCPPDPPYPEWNPSDSDFFIEGKIPLNYFAQILCYKNRESIDIIVILNFYENSTSRWYKGGSQL